MNYVSKFLHSSPFDRRFIFVSTCLTAIIIVLLTPFTVKQYNTFSHQIGESILDNIDIQARLFDMYSVLFLIIPIIFFILWFAISRWCQKAPTNNINHLNIFLRTLIIPIIGVLFSDSVFAGVTKSALLYVGIIVYFLIFIRQEMSTLKTQFILLMSIPICLIGWILFYLIGISLGATASFLLLVGMFGLCTLILHFVSNKVEKWCTLEDQIYMIKPLVLLPLLLSLGLEFLNVLAQRFDFRLLSPLGVFAILMVILLGYTCKRGYQLYTKNECRLQTQQLSSYYFWLLLGILFLVYQPHRTYTLSLQPFVYFEAANDLLGLNEFIFYGKIPVLETFDAHMLMNQVTGYIYYFFTGDGIGVLFRPYGDFVYILIQMLLFIFYKYIFKKDSIAFLLVLFIPFNYYIIDPSRLLFLPVVFILIRSVQKKTLASYLTLALLLVLTCFIYLDLGFSTILATSVMLIILYIKDKRNIDWYKLGIASLIVTVLAISLALFVATLRNVNLLERLQEFLSIAKSDINWGHSILGDNNTIAFVVIYFLLPVIIVVSYGICFFQLKFKHLQMNTPEFIILSMLALLYVANFHRGLMRHSLVEGSITPVFTAILYLALLFYLYSGRKLQYFLVPLLVTPFLHTEPSLAFFEQYNTSTNLINTIGTRMNKKSAASDTMLGPLDTVSKERGSIDDATYKHIKILMDGALKDNESFIEYANHTLLYALLKREKPFYINQSPGLLTDEMSQRYFISQIENKRKELPFVLTALDSSAGFDEVPTSLKQYLATEYVYQNYTPYLIIDQKFILYIDKEKFEEKINSIREIIQSNLGAYQVIDDNMLIGENRSYNLKHLPYLWGEKSDEKKIWNRHILNKKILDGTLAFANISDGFFEKGVNKADRKTFIVPYTPLAAAQLEQAKDVRIDGVDYPIDSVKNLNSHFLYVTLVQELPYPIISQEIEVVQAQHFKIDSDILLSSYQYILVEITSDHAEEADLAFGQTDENGKYQSYAKYQFYIKQGEKLTYAIRVSAEANWSRSVNTISIVAKDIEGDKISVSIA